MSSLRTVAILVTMALGQLVVASALPESQQDPHPLSNLRARQQQTEGTALFLDEPACDYYQCAVTYYPGDNATAHWLNAPTGNVILEMLSHFANMSDQPVATVPGVTTDCDTEGTGNTCGQFSWIIPSSWVGGNFTLQATSSSDSSIQSYTDTILVLANPNSTATVAYSALDPYISGSSTINPSSTTSASGASTSSASSNTVTSAASGTTTTTPGASSSSTTSGSGGSSSSSTDAATTNYIIQSSLILLPITIALCFVYL